MRKLLLSLALGTGAATSLAAQAMPWAPEVGIRSTFGKLDIEDTKVTMIDIPGGSGIEGFGGNAALYATIPVNDRWAVEPSLSMSDLASEGFSIMQVNAGARVMFSAMGAFYVGAGPSVTVLKLEGEELTRWGGQVAAGYRFNVGGAVRGRAELFYATLGENDDFGLPESSELGLAVALGLATGERRSTGSRDGMWDLAFGVQGGYSHLTAPGNGEVTSFSLPGSNGEMAFFGGPLPQLAPWFVQIPVGERFAVEPSFGYHSYDVDGSGNGSMYNVGVRGNYAFNRNLYAAVSGEMIGVGGDDFDGVGGITGIGAAVGVRYPLVAGLTGRTEFSYRTFTGGDDAFVPDHQVTGISFGVSAPLR